MTLFVKNTSIVRQIWGNSDTILFIFGGAAAEFSLNKAVDWLYFTGKLPNDPLARLFSTVVYAQQIIFSDEETALKSIDKIAAIHHAVEESRGAKIPDWAYRDVLYLLIYYSIAAYELLERKLSEAEKEEVFDVFYRVGKRMNLQDLPENYPDWLLSREKHLKENLEKSTFTTDLYRQYRKHLGLLRYCILLEGQKNVVPKQIRILLKFRNYSLLTPLLSVYKIIRHKQMATFLKSLLLPLAYQKQIKAMNFEIV